VQTLSTHFSAIDGTRKIPGVDISDETIAEALWGSRTIFVYLYVQLFYTFPQFLTCQMARSNKCLTLVATVEHLPLR